MPPENAPTVSINGGRGAHQDAQKIHESLIIVDEVFQDDTFLVGGARSLPRHLGLS